MANGSMSKQGDMIARRADGTTYDLAAAALPLTGGDVAKVLSDTTVTALDAQACVMAIIQNDPDSPGNLKVGFTNAPKVKLAPGQFAPPIFVENLNLIYVQAVSTATANIMYRR